MCIEGVSGIVDAENPNSIDQRLKVFLSPKLRDQERAA
jgi:hypothetical protein